MAKNVPRWFEATGLQTTLRCEKLLEDLVDCHDQEGLSDPSTSDLHELRAGAGQTPPSDLRDLSVRPARPARAVGGVTL